MTQEANPAAKTAVDEDLKTLCANKRITHKKLKNALSTGCLLPTAAVVASPAAEIAG